MNELDVAVCTRAELVELLRQLSIPAAAVWVSRIHQVRKDISTTLQYDSTGVLCGWFLGHRIRGNPWK